MPCATNSPIRFGTIKNAEFLAQITRPLAKRAHNPAIALPLVTSDALTHQLGDRALHLYGIQYQAADTQRYLLQPHSLNPPPAQKALFASEEDLKRHYSLWPLPQQEPHHPKTDPLLLAPAPVRPMLPPASTHVPPPPPPPGLAEVKRLVELRKPVYVHPITVAKDQLSLNQVYKVSELVGNQFVLKPVGGNLDKPFSLIAQDQLLAAFQWMPPNDHPSHFNTNA